MTKTTSNKKNHVILAVLSMLAVILLAAFYLQGRQIGRFIDGPDEKSWTEIKADRSLQGKSVSQDVEKTYQTKIKKLEAQISEMQRLQDHLEENLNKYDFKDDFAVSDLPEKDAVSKAKENFFLRRNFLKQHRDFLNQNNYPPELNDKLFDLFVERNVTLDEIKTNAQNAGFKNIEVDADEIDRRIEEINAEYDDKTAELLSEDGLALLKEYEKRFMERSLVMDFEDMLGDETLEKEKERELIELMYKRRQDYMPYLQDDLSDALLDHDAMRKTLGAYIVSADGILSESQTKKFKAFINYFKKIAVPDNTPENNSDKE